MQSPFYIQQKEAAIEFIELKLSKAILIVVEDVKSFQQKGVAIDLRYYWKFNDKTNQIASLCLGGAAVHRFFKRSDDMQRFDKWETYLDKIKYTFDILMQGEYEYAIHTWCGLSTDMSDIKQKSFTGLLSQKQISEMINHLKYLSEEFKKRGF